jgi:hypothetical protein
LANLAVQCAAIEKELFQRQDQSDSLDRQIDMAKHEYDRQNIRLGLTIKRFHGVGPNQEDAVKQCEMEISKLEESLHDSHVVLCQLKTARTDVLNSIIIIQIQVQEKQRVYLLKRAEFDAIQSQIIQLTTLIGKLKEDSQQFLSDQATLRSRHAIQQHTLQQAQQQALLHQLQPPAHNTAIEYESRRRRSSQTAKRDLDDDDDDDEPSEVSYSRDHYSSRPSRNRDRDNYEGSYKRRR